MTKYNLAVFITLFLLSLAVIFFNQSKPVLLFRNYLGDILLPSEIIFSKIGNGMLFFQNVFINIKKLKELNIELAAENLELYGKLAKSSQLEEENLYLKVVIQDIRY